MTTRKFLLKKQITWVQIAAWREEMKINRKRIRDIKARNKYLETLMSEKLQDMQTACEDIDAKEFNDDEHS